MNQLQLHSKGNVEEYMKDLFLKTFHLKFNTSHDYFNIFLSYLTFIKAKINSENMNQIKKTFETCISFMNKCKIH
jgi:hypothetical protein